jgi:hypothetical protein
MIVVQGILQYVVSNLMHYYKLYEKEKGTYGPR